MDKKWIMKDVYVYYKDGSMTTQGTLTKSDKEGITLGDKLFIPWCRIESIRLKSNDAIVNDNDEFRV